MYAFHRVVSPLHATCLHWALVFRSLQSSASISYSKPLNISTITQSFLPQQNSLPSCSFCVCLQTTGQDDTQQGFFSSKLTILCYAFQNRSGIFVTIARYCVPSKGILIRRYLVFHLPLQQSKYVSTIIFMQQSFNATKDAKMVV